jgi:hypothetical protein
MRRRHNIFASADPYLLLPQARKAILAKAVDIGLESGSRNQVKSL